MLDRPLHLCEVLEEEHVSLYGEEFRVTASDILDPNAIAKECTRRFVDTQFSVLSRHQEIDLRSEAAAVARDLNSLIEDPDPEKRKQNRKRLEEFLGSALAKAGEGRWDFRPPQIRNPEALRRTWKRVVEEEPEEWLRDCGSKTPAESRREITDGLNGLVNGPTVLTEKYKKLLNNVTTPTRKLIEGADDLTAEQRQYVNRRILDDVFSGALQRGEEARLSKVYEVIHAAGPTSALCISGGGIRSATFALGVLQGFARRHMLDKFDYVSTVSGGGYIGSWLSSWMRRHTEGPRGVAEDLARPPADKLSPEPKPVQHLRDFSNYLTPRLGAFSGDTLAAAALYLRNLLLNWTILIPLLLAALALPRAVHAIYFRSASGDLDANLHTVAVWLATRASVAKIGIGGAKTDAVLTAVAEPISNGLIKLADSISAGSDLFFIRWLRGIGMFTHTAAWLGGLALLIGVLYIGRHRPCVNRFGEADPGKVQGHFLMVCLLPFLIASIALTAAWARLTQSGADSIPLAGLLLFIAVPIVSGAIYSWRFASATSSDRRESFLATLWREESIWNSKFVRESIACAIASVISAILVSLLASFVFPQPYQKIGVDTFPSPVLALHEQIPVSAFYVCFAVPLVIGVFFVAATVFVGVSSAVNEDYDREWWARAAGYFVGATIIWIAVTATVIFGPIAIHFAPRAIVGIGGIAGVVSLVLGRSSKTGGKEREKKSPTDIAAMAAAPVFILFLLAGGSLLTSKVFEPETQLSPTSAAMLQSLRWSSEQRYAARQGVDAATLAGLNDVGVTPLARAAGVVAIKTEMDKRPLFDRTRFAAWMHLRSVEASALPSTLFFGGLLVVIAGIASICVNVNKFSMHSLYRNRLIRAYLGASRSTRDPNPFTGFDPQDDIAMHQLRPEMLWASSFRDLDGFVACLTGGKCEAKKAKFSARLRDMIEAIEPDVFQHARRPEFVAELFQILNHVLDTQDLEAERWDARRKSHWNLKMAFGRPNPFSTSGSDPRRLRRNRRKLDETYGGEIYPFDFPLLHRPDVADGERLAAILREPMLKISAPAEQQTAEATPLQAWLRAQLSAAAKKALDTCRLSNERINESLEIVLGDLNRILTEFDFATMKRLVTPYPRDYQLIGRNRAILDGELKTAIHRLTTPRPMHVINVALNLVSGEKLAWQERKAQSFTVSPMHSGSFDLGYRPSARYGGPAGISLGTAVTISGAAVSPNMGYHSSPTLAFLLTLFNVRLGWWLGNPGPYGQHTWLNECPTSALRPLTAELSGSTNDRLPYVYLSDGGHFENLGLYEMVLRRRRYIVVSDAGCDPTYAFEDLGNAIRKIRTDLGVPIEIHSMFLYPRSKENSDPKVGRYCAYGRIRYSCVDPTGEDGELLYIKPAVYLTEPKDVYNYAMSSLAFPHETTADQWFSESQFESYRVLGYHAVDRICMGAEDPNAISDERLTVLRNWVPPSFREFFDRAEAHARMEAEKAMAVEAQSPAERPAMFAHDEGRVL